MAFATAIVLDVSNMNPLPGLIPSAKIIPNVEDIAVVTINKPMF